MSERMLEEDYYHVSRLMANLRDSLLRIKWDKDLTNLELSLQCDISTSKLDQILYDCGKGIQLQTLARISENLGVTISDLVGQGKGGVVA